MVICKNCNSMNVKVANGNFASAKPEGQPAVVHKFNKYFFHCWDCESNWESIPEAEKDYLDYVWLRDRTTLVARSMGSDGSYGPAQFIEASELMRRTELAKKIHGSYRHLLDLDPGEWHEIDQDAQ